MPVSLDAEIGAISMETYASEGIWKPTYVIQNYLMETYVSMADRHQDYNFTISNICM